MKTKLMKALIITGLIIGSSACTLGHKNPLSRINEDDAAQFLADASHYAELKIKKNISNHGYAECMDEKLDAKICQRIYQAMLAYAKTQNLYKNMTYADLTDFDVWQKLKEDYGAKAYNMLPLPESAYQ